MSALRSRGISAAARVDPAGPLQRAAERERGLAPFRSVEIVPVMEVALR